MGRPLEGQEARISTLDFSRDGRTLATASEDGTVVLWDVAARKPVGSPLTVRRQPLVSAAFTPDGSHLFAVSDRGRGVRFDVRLEAWKRQACLVAGHELTAREMDGRARGPAVPDRLPARIGGRRGGTTFPMRPGRFRTPHPAYTDGQPAFAGGFAQPVTGGAPALRAQRRALAPRALGAVAATRKACGTPLASTCGRHCPTLVSNQ